MPYTPATAPPYVKSQLSGSRLAQWCQVWNSANERCMGRAGSDAKDCEGRAFAQANSVAGVKAQK